MKKEDENSNNKNNGKQEEGKGEDGLYSMTNKNANQETHSDSIAGRSRSIEGYEEEKKTKEGNEERGHETDGNESIEEERMKGNSCVVIDSNKEEDLAYDLLQVGKGWKKESMEKKEEKGNSAEDTAERMHEKNRQDEAKTSEPHKDERNDSKEGDNEGESSDGSVEIPFSQCGPDSKKKGIPFQVKVVDKVPGKIEKKTKENKKGQKKDVCDVCGTKTKSGHVKCEICGQWKHVKCVGKTFNELKKEGYKCPKCTVTDK